MDEIQIQLKPRIPKNVKTIQVLVGVFFVFIGTLATSDNTIFSFIILCYGLLLLFFHIIIEPYLTYPYLILNEGGIKGKFSFFKKEIVLTWDVISKVNIKILSIDIFTKEGSVYHIKLNDLDYNQVRYLKSEAATILNEKGLLTEAIKSE